MAASTNDVRIRSSYTLHRMKPNMWRKAIKATSPTTMRER
jgi:hypothetical protein